MDTTEKLPVLEFLKDGFGDAIECSDGLKYLCELYEVLSNKHNAKSFLVDLVFDYLKRDTKTQCEMQCVDELIKVWQFGRKKYPNSVDHWKTITPEQHASSLLRHFVARGKSLRDDESGLLHSAHMLWRALAIVWFIKNDQTY